MKSGGGALGSEKGSKSLTRLLLLAAIFCTAMAVSSLSWSAHAIASEEKAKRIKMPGGREVVITTVTTDLMPTDNPIVWIDDHQFFFTAVSGGDHKKHVESAEKNPVETFARKNIYDINIYIYTLGKGAELYQRGTGYCYNPDTGVVTVYRLDPGKKEFTILGPVYKVARRRQRRMAAR